MPSPIGIPLLDETSTKGSRLLELVAHLGHLGMGVPRRGHGRSHSDEGHNERNQCHNPSPKNPRWPSVSYEILASDSSAGSSISSIFILPMCFRMSLLMSSIASVVPVSCVKNSATASTMLCLTHNMKPSWMTM